MKITQCGYLQKNLLVYLPSNPFLLLLLLLALLQMYQQKNLWKHNFTHQLTEYVEFMQSMLEISIVAEQKLPVSNNHQPMVKQEECYKMMLVVMLMQFMKSDLLQNNQLKWPKLKELPMKQRQMYQILPVQQKMLLVALMRVELKLKVSMLVKFILKLQKLLTEKLQRQ